MSAASSRSILYPLILAILALSASCSGGQDPGPEPAAPPTAAPASSPRLAGPTPLPADEADEEEDFYEEDEELLPQAGATPVFPVDAGPPEPLAQRICQALHALPAQRKAACCGDGIAQPDLSAECTRTLSVVLRDQAVRVEPAEVDRCVQEAEARLAGCDWVTPLAPPVPPACRRLVHGQLASGAVCRSDLECREGLYCQGASSVQKGVCAEPAPVGTACSLGGDLLASYTRQVGWERLHPECSGYCQMGQCSDFVPVGGPCASNLQCATGQRCEQNRCTDKPLAKLGEACSSGGCEEGATCTDGRCVALKAAGEACTKPFECQAYCIMTPGASSGVCGKQCVALAPSLGTPAPSPAP